MLKNVGLFAIKKDEMLKGIQANPAWLGYESKVHTGLEYGKEVCQVRFGFKLFWHFNIFQKSLFYEFIFFLTFRIFCFSTFHP